MNFQLHGYYSSMYLKKLQVLFSVLSLRVLSLHDAPAQRIKAVKHQSIPDWKSIPDPLLKTINTKISNALLLPSIPRKYY